MADADLSVVQVPSDIYEKRNTLRTTVAILQRRKTPQINKQKKGEGS